MNLIKPPRSGGQLMLWGAAGLAYFNLFSSLALEPGLRFGLSGVVPMTVLIVYLLMKRSPDESDES
jgi:hypothetical protein